MSSRTSLCSEGANWLELVDDHPLLWEFKHESASAFFYGTPVNADAAVGALYEAHQNAVGTWIRFGKYLKQPTRAFQVAGRRQRFAGQGPVPLLTLYKETLRPLGVDVDVRFPRLHKLGMELVGGNWSGKDTKALLMGTSYVIGNGWSAEQIAQRWLATKLCPVILETVRREKALDFSGCNSSPTGSLHPVAIETAAEATKLSELSM